MTTTETTPSQDGAGDGATRIPLKGIQRVAARRMTEAWAAPVFHVAIEPGLFTGGGEGRGMGQWGGAVTGGAPPGSGEGDQTTSDLAAPRRR